MAATTALDKLLYGALSRPDQPMRLLAAVGNCALAAYFVQRVADTKTAERTPLTLLQHLLLLLLLTLAAHACVRDAVGVSTVWSWMYGLLSLQCTPLDHALYWTPAVAMLLPLPALRPAIWPWPPAFQSIACGAHLLFAWGGWASTRL